MAYVPNATTVTEPVDTRKASTAALEFRTLKAYIQSVIVPATGDKLPLAGGIMSGDISFSDSDFRINANTADATDDKRIVISGGGGFSDTRGANLLLAGNEHASQPGQANLYAGSTGSILLSATTTQITAAVMTWSGNPTHSGSHTFTNTLSVGNATTFAQLQTNRLYVQSPTQGLLDIDANPADGLGASTVRLHRTTNTTGVVGFAILRGNGSTTQDFSFVSGVNAAAQFSLNGTTGSLRINGSNYGTIGIRQNGSYGGGAPGTTVDDLVIENNAAAGISILTPNNVDGNIRFGDPENNIVGGIRYRHTVDTLDLVAAGAVQFSVSALVCTVAPPIRTANGSAAAPAYAFVNSDDMGMYRNSSTSIGFAVGGVQQATLSSADGALRVTGLVYGRGGGAGMGQITVSTTTPSGGANGDIWFQY